MTDVDVVVAGAGAAGLAGAIAASEAGSSVLVLEALETFQYSSNTAMSTAMIPAAGSRWQQSADIDDSPELFLDDVMVKTKGTADRVVANALVHEAPHLVHWLADNCDVPLSLVTDFVYPGHSRPRCHTVPDRAGTTLHRQLLQTATRDCDLMVPARLQSLHRGSDQQSWEVEFYVGENTERVSSRSVILATNGFAANAERVHSLIPQVASGLYFGGEGSSGTMLQLADRHGWDVSHLDAYQGHGSVAVPHAVLATWAIVMHGGFIVNEDARRFADESSGYSEFAELILGQPCGTGWLIFDAAIDDKCRVFSDYERLIQSGAIKWADSIAELGRVTGLDADALQHTFDEVAGVHEGQPDVFGRQAFEQPLNPRYAAVHITGALFHTQGGLKVDAHAQVLSNDAPVAGVFAAGGAAVGISGHGSSGYLAGNGLLAALGLGRIAGVRAAALAGTVHAGGQR